MFSKLPSRKLLILLLAVALFASLAVAATVNASHMTPMQACASHGLGPNFHYAEGTGSVLARCLTTTSTDHN